MHINVRQPAIALIRVYQSTISPFLPRACRFEPSCSQFAIEAIQEMGFLKGVGKSLKRLLRCHPFCAGGYDPVEKNGF